MQSLLSNPPLTQNQLRYSAAIRQRGCFSRGWLTGDQGVFGNDELRMSRLDATPIHQHLLVFPLTDYSFEWFTPNGTKLARRYPGQVVYLPVGAPLGFRLVEGLPFYSLAGISTTLLDSVAGRSVGELQPFEFEDEMMCQLALSLRTALEDERPASARMVDSVLTALAARFWSIYLENHQCLSQATLSTVAAAQSFARTKLGQPLLAEDLARVALVSTSQLNRDFQKEMGCGAMTWLRSERLETAAALLSTTELPISEIARQVGFSDGPHLTRLFVEWKKCTPAKWRRTIRSSVSVQ